MFNCDGSGCSGKGECADRILRQKAHVRADATPVRSPEGGKRQIRFEESLLSVQDLDAQVFFRVIGKKVPATSILA